MGEILFFENFYDFLNFEDFLLIFFIFIEFLCFLMNVLDFIIQKRMKKKKIVALVADSFRTYIMI